METYERKKEDKKWYGKEKKGKDKNEDERREKRQVRIEG